MDAWPKGGVERANLLKFDQLSDVVDFGRASRIFSRAKPPFL